MELTLHARSILKSRIISAQIALNLVQLPL